MRGPYQTQRQAADSVRHITDSPPGAGAWQDGSHRLLEGACRAAGVKLGAYDEQVLVWLAGWEPWVCAVIAGLISRAHRVLDAGQLGTMLDALDVAADYKRDRAAGCPDCPHTEGGVCGTCEWRLARAAEYDALAEALRGQR